MIRPYVLAVALAAASTAAAVVETYAADAQLGPRPFHLVDRLPDGELKSKLAACTGPFQKTDWSIGHRGAPLQFPEHSKESYLAAARMGAGILECDVTFTKDKQLVCRHAQDDLHTTTNILATELAGKCTGRFIAARRAEAASAECRASDITLGEFKTLKGKMDAADKKATTVEAYMNGTAGWRTDLYAADGTLMTHAESIELFKSLGVKFTPELKTPIVNMPFDGFTQEMYAQKLIDDYKAAGIPASDVFAQSFNLDDILYWIKNEPDFGKQAVYLESGYRNGGWSPEDETSWQHSMADLKQMGVNFIAPPLWVLVKAENGKMVPSLYAKKAKEAGLNIIGWTLERSGPLASGGGWYYQTVGELIKDDSDKLRLMQVLAQDVGIVGLFSDWPATTTFYANCMGLK